MQEEPSVRVGVVGTGVMGGHHTRVASTLPGCELVGIYDAATERATQVAVQYGIAAFPTLPALCAAVDAVIIASPTITHAEVAGACLQAGCHVLLEKPIAVTLDEAQALVDLEAQSDRVLMIGHIERYNPATTTLLSLLNPDDLFAGEWHRLSPVAGRDQSADIILDLMIHDLDLVLACIPAPVVGLEAVGHAVRGELIDHVTASLRFASGATAILTASAVSQERVRRARLFAREVQYTVDFGSRKVWRHTGGAACAVEQIPVPQGDPLATEQAHFLQAIRTGATPATSAAAGMEALRLALAIQQSVTERCLAYA